MPDFFPIPVAVSADMDTEQLHSELAALGIANLGSTIITQRQLLPSGDTLLDGQGRPVLGPYQIIANLNGTLTGQEQASVTTTIASHVPIPIEV